MIDDLRERLRAGLREDIEGILASRQLARPGDVEALRSDLERLAAEATERGIDEAMARVATLSTRIDDLERALEVALATVRAATRQVAQARSESERAQQAAREAHEAAQQAVARAEALMDRLDAEEPHGPL